MDSDPIEAVTQGAKAVQEVAKATGKVVDASSRVGVGLTASLGRELKTASRFIDQIA